MLKGVKIIGVKNVMNRLVIQLQVYMLKIYLVLLEIFYSKEKKKFFINMEDEIIKNTFDKRV